MIYAHRRASFRASGPWTPTILGAALWAWYDATQQGGSDGVAVSQLTDYSGNSRTLSTAGAGGLPVYRATGFSGSKPCFDCATSRAAFGSHSATMGSLAWFVAWRWQTGSARRVIVHDSGGTDFDTVSVWIPLYNETTSGRAFSARANQFPVAASGLSAGTDHIAASVTADTSLATWVDGTAGGTATFGSGNLNATTVRIGGSSAGYSDSRIAEAFAVTGAMTTDIRQRAEGYLAHKYALTGLLPASHPYKTSPP